MCVCVCVCVITLMKRSNTPLVSCTEDRLCCRFHSPATSAVNRPSSQFYKYLGEGGRGGGLWLVRESLRVCEKEVRRADKGGQWPAYYKKPAASKQTAPSAKVSDKQLEQKEYLFWSHDWEAHPFYFPSFSILGSVPWVVPGQPALWPDIWDASISRGDARLSQQPLAWLYAPSHWCWDGLPDAQRSSACTHHAHAHGASSSNLCPRLVTPAQHWDVWDQADTRWLEGELGCQPFCSWGAHSEDQGWCGGDQR